MVGKPKLPNWLAYIRPHVEPYQALGRGERRKYIEKLSKQTKLSDNSLRRMIAAAQFLEAEGITDLPPDGRLPLGSVENIARIAAHEPSRRRELLDEVRAGRTTIDQLAEELWKTRKRAKRLGATQQVPLDALVVETLKTKKGIDPKVVKTEKYAGAGAIWMYFDPQNLPSLLVHAKDYPPMVVMDGRHFGGGTASFMQQRKEFLRNVLVSATLFDAVLVYAPHSQEDIKRLIGHVHPEVARRILLIGDTGPPEVLIRT